MEAESSLPGKPDNHQDLPSGLRHPLVVWIGVSVLVLFGVSSARHLLFHSTGFDLGIYDQVVYLMSRGEPPISSYLGFHHLGNHAAWSVYPLALLYWVYPSVYWLLAVQAIALSLGAVPTWFLARQAGLSHSLTLAVTGAYLLYPLLFNLSLFDFHPEVMALPVLLTAIWAARSHRIGIFTVAILFVLGCKAVLSLTVAAMGIWLLGWERRQICGAIALVLGISWFLVATQWMIPTFSGAEAAAVGRYDYLGDSVLEIVLNLLRRPGPVLERVLRWDTPAYLLLITLPFAWGLSFRHLTPLISAVPALAMNILSDVDTQRTLHHHYSLPILPFLLVAVIATLAAGGGFLRQRRWILLWSLVMFLWLARYDRFPSRYLTTLDNWQANREAIALIQTQGNVFTDNHLAPHLSHRPMIRLLPRHTRARHLQGIDYVLLDVRHPWAQRNERAESALAAAQADPNFELTYEQDQVYLFVRRELSSNNSNNSNNFGFFSLDRFIPKIQQAMNLASNLASN
jgi:uncharacterized membrane protein